MMPFCEYRKCKKVAEGTIGLLRKWDTYDVHHTNHAQEIWLCDKHNQKISKLLSVSVPKEQQEEDSDGRV